MRGVDAPEHTPVPESSAPPSPGKERHLSDVEERILAFEQQRWKYAGAKASAVLDEFDMTETRYYQVLNALIDRPEAAAHAPTLVARLQRVRRKRQQQRSQHRPPPQ